MWLRAKGSHSTFSMTYIYMYSHGLIYVVQNYYKGQCLLLVWEPGVLEVQGLGRKSGLGVAYQYGTLGSRHGVRLVL